MGVQLISTETGEVVADYQDLAFDRLFALSWDRLYDVYDIKGNKVNLCEAKLDSKRWQETPTGKEKYRVGKNRAEHKPGICAHYLRRLENTA